MQNDARMLKSAGNRWGGGRWTLPTCKQGCSLGQQRLLLGHQVVKQLLAAVEVGVAWLCAVPHLERLLDLGPPAAKGGGKPRLSTCECIPASLTQILWLLRDFGQALANPSQKRLHDSQRVDVRFELRLSQPHVVLHEGHDSAWWPGPHSERGQRSPGSRWRSCAPIHSRVSGLVKVCVAALALLTNASVAQNEQM